MDICGHCGETVADSINALCANCKGDFWVQPQDFNNPDLKGHIQSAADNLDMSVEKLRDIVESSS